MTDIPVYIPLPDKPVHQLQPDEMVVFRQWMGWEPGAPIVPYPTPEEAQNRSQREEWKARYAGKGAVEPRLLIREEQLNTLQANAAHHEAARKWRDERLELAEIAGELPGDFFGHFIQDMGPWNPGGNCCPNCVNTTRR